MKKSRFKLKPWMLIVIMFPPVLLAWPVLPDFKPFPLRQNIGIQIATNPIKASDLPKEFPIKGGSDSIGSKALISNFLNGIKASSMPVELCFSNDNKIYEGKKEIDPRTLIDADEAGAMSFKFRNPDTNLPSEIYVKLGEKNKCQILPTIGISLEKNGIEIRHPLPLRVKALPQEDSVEIRVEPVNIYLSLYTEPGYYHIIWKTSIFLTNYILFLLAWGGIIKFVEWLISSLFQKSQSDQSASVGSA